MTGMESEQFDRVILAIVIAAILACVFTIFTATAEPADSKDAAAENRTSGHADSRCTARGWPYYEAQCLREVRLQYGQRIPMRIVTTER